MKFPIRTIPDSLKARDFLVYSLKNSEEGYHVRKNIPTLVGQLKDISVSTTGFVRYSMVRLVPRTIGELFYEGGKGLPISPRPSRHKHGADDMVTPGDYILVCKFIPNGWFGVDFGPLRANTAVIPTFREVISIASNLWLPYRPDNPLRRQHPWGCCFEDEADAVAFQAHIAANTENGSLFR